ncbi:FixH family protein [Pseudomonas sp. nanlin1]|uniref:FixH family protein n=1 Tax=Pseudomonas sp. nanlin1 TaxID=3040605 RepID=UPI00388FE47B
MPLTPAASPWYRHRWPWILIALLGGSVTLSLATVAIAVKHPVDLVSDNYYDAGKGINRALDRERLAQALHLRATLQVDALTGEVALRLQGDSLPASLALNLISPTQPSQDRHLTLHRDPAGRYIGQLNDAVAGRRFVELLGEDAGHAWRLFEEERVIPGRALTLGDEPLQAEQRP